MDNNTEPNFVESERGIILNSPLPEDGVRNNPTEQKPRKKHEAKIVGFILLLLVIGGLAFVATQIDYTAIADTIAANGYEAPEELSKLIEEIDLTDDGMRILKASRPELQEADAFNQNCTVITDGTTVLGCYHDKRIYVYNIQKTELNGIRQTTLAHELLHAIWERMSYTERQAILPSLKSVYDGSEMLQRDLEKTSPDSFDDELHSRVGTQLDPEKMPEDLRTHYAKYFKQPAKIFAFYDKYNSIFEDFKKQAEELLAIIDEHHTKYDEMLAEYEAEFKQWTLDKNDFNQRASSGAIATTEQFKAERTALINRQDELQKKRNVIIEYAKETNNYVDTYNSSVRFFNELQDSIISKPSELSGN